MTALDTDDLAVITGPLEVMGQPDTVHLVPREVVRIIEGQDEDGQVWVYGMESELNQYIDASSLTPLSEIHAISGADGFERATAPLQQGPEVLWGETPYVVFSDIHDYVYEGDE